MIGPVRRWQAGAEKERGVSGGRRQRRYRQVARRAAAGVARELPGLAVALRGAVGRGYRAGDLWADLRAGLTVASLALPLSVALASALSLRGTGVRPEDGVYAAIVAGAVAALLGGSRGQITGPTAAFVVALTPVGAQLGLWGVAMATLLAGVIQTGMGLLRFGRFVEFIPSPVTTGFTAGIGLVIAVLQVRDFVGLPIDALPTAFVDKVWVLAQGVRAHLFSGAGAVGVSGVSAWSDALVGVVTLGAMFAAPRLPLVRRLPGPPVGIVLGTLLVMGLGAVWPWFEPATLASRFGGQGAQGGVAAGLPAVVWPWGQPGAGGGPVAVTTASVRLVLITALALAMMGSINSLISAGVADGLTGARHDPDSELVAQGLGNVAAPFFGGFACAGEVARTVVSVRAGSRSPVAGVAHAGVLLASLLVLAPALGRVPMASLAALMLFMARGMVDPKNLLFLARHAPRADAALLGVCFGVTVLIDVATAVAVGVTMASVVFMRRMADEIVLRPETGKHPAWDQPVPAGVVLFRAGGPLFFGAARRALGQLAQAERGTRVIIVDMSAVPSVDATAMAALDSAVGRLRSAGVLVVLSAVRARVERDMIRAGWEDRDDAPVITGNVEAGVEVARAWVEAQ
ncbi:MAG: C4-dicarboxylic acid transporter DauA [Planctomyces sp.]|nr:C4-dicarboxylic acid transporter DauA [Planctomyces sp.]